MPLPPAHSDTIFKYVAFMQNTANPDVNWRASLEISQAAGHPLPGDPIIGACQTFMASGLLNDCQIYQDELRYWTFGHQTDFHAFPIWKRAGVNLSGNKPATYGGQNTFSAYGSCVMFIDKLTADARRDGKMFLRGWLDADDVAAIDGGRFTIRGGARISIASFEANSVDNLLDPYFGAVDPGLVVVRYNLHQLVPVFTPIVDMLYREPITFDIRRRNKK